MIRVFRILVRAVVDGTIKKVSVSVTRKREGLEVNATVFTGKFTHGVSNYLPKGASVASTLSACAARLRDLVP